MKKFAFFLLMCLVVTAAVLLQPVTANATDIPVRYCQGCKANVPLTDWVAIGGEQTEMVKIEAGKHYYLTADITGAPTTGVLLSGAGCIDLNGSNITAGEGCAAISCGAGTTNIMGSGTISGSRAAADIGATIHTSGSAVVHLYGGTIRKSGNYPAIHIGKNCKVHLYDGATLDTVGTFKTYPTAVYIGATGGLFHMHGGTINGGSTTGNGGAIRVSAGSMIMDGGTINGGRAARGGAVAVNKDISSKATLTVNGGTITGGKAYETNGGGNLYVNYVTITINGGLITKGVAESTSYGGGNLGSRLGTFIINGGTISEGSTGGSQGGGNVYLSGATLTMNGGTITGGTSSNTAAQTGGGNVYMYNSSTFTQNDGVITLGTSDSSYGGGNIYMAGVATYNMYDGEISYGKCTNTSCRGGGNIYVQTDTCFLNIVGGKLQYGYLEDGYGNNIHQRYGKLYMGPDAYMGSKGTGTKGDMSVYVYSGTVESYATFTGGFKVAGGKAYLKGGQYYSFYYEGSSICEITGGRFRDDYSKYVPEGYQMVSVATTGSYKYAVLPVGGTTDTVLVDYAGKETFTYSAASVFNTSTYSHIKLYNDATLQTQTTKDLWVDLNGKNLTVTGEGKLNAFDTANDTYDASACGTITNNGNVEITQDVQAHSGSRYVAVPDGTATTMHRLDAKLTTVSLRPSAAGIYYKAVYYCDDALSARVRAYGVVLSVNNMPGNDFLNENSSDINKHTVSQTAFKSGVTATSGSVFGILKKGRDAATNTAYSNTTIYANPYICFQLDETVVFVGDAQNANKKKGDTDFTGKAYSLHDVMAALDVGYHTYSTEQQQQMDSFYATWKERGVDWDFVNIRGEASGEEEPGEQPGGEPEEPPEEEKKDVLELVDGQALCTACNQMVTWTPLDQETYATTAYGTATHGTHIYLAEDITYTGTAVFLTAPSTASKIACLHLNGKSLTVTKTRALVGSYGTLNVMGDGVVAGYVKSAGYGGAVQINTTYSGGKVNLYGGTYRQVENAGADSCVISVRPNGGTINVYENVRLEANTTGKAAWTGGSTSTNSALCLYGAYVDGDIYITGADPTKGKTSKLVMDGVTVNGTVDVNGITNVVLAGDPSVKLLDLETAAVAQIEDLSTEANIPLRANGWFTTVYAGAEEHVKCFTPAEPYYRIVAEDGTLACRANYPMAVTPGDSGMSYCAVCGKDVKWQALDSAGEQVTLTDGQHLYLTDSLTWDGSEPFILAPETAGHTACVNLNGNNITAAGSEVFHSAGGVLNVMGSGTVNGCVAASVNAANAKISLYSGEYINSSAASNVVAVGTAGGTLELYADVRVTAADDCAVSVDGGAANAALKLYGTQVDGDVMLSAPAEGAISANIHSANITGKLVVGSGTDVTLTGRPKIGNMIVAEGTLVNLEDILTGTNVAVSAEEVFTQPLEKAKTWLTYFTAADDGDWIVEQDGALSCRVWKTLPNGGKILVIGNSMTYYSKYVLEKSQTATMSSRANDQGYLYQVCKANYLDVSVTNFTFGNHSLKDFYSGKCAADRGHNGYNHLKDLAGGNYDYVILQQGNGAAATENILAECQPLMDLFLEVNPDTKFVFLVQYTVHTEETAWRATIKELEENGIIVVDWGALVTDLINGAVTPPDALETYSKFSLIVNKSAADGRHPNILAGYLAAQMTYCAITGESAVGQDYSFWNDTTANSAFKLSSYKSTYYAYDKTVPSNTNFEAVFKSTQEMTGLQKLIDQYLKEKSYKNY